MLQLDRFPRVRLGHLPTPLEPMARLSAHLGGPTLWIKRDDCTGLATGGNKTRKLEYLVADALAAGCRHADHLGRVAIQPRAPDGGRGGKARAEMRARAGGARLAGDRRLSPQRQRAARPPARRHVEICAARQFDDRCERNGRRRGAAQRWPALRHPRRRLECRRRAGLCRLRAGNPAAGGGARRQDRPRRARHRQQRHASRAHRRLRRHAKRRARARHHGRPAARQPGEECRPHARRDLGPSRHDGRRAARQHRGQRPAISARPTASRRRP